MDPRAWRAVASHPLVLAWGEGLLTHLDLAALPYPGIAEAARALAEDQDASQAVSATPRCAEGYGLQVQADRHPGTPPGGARLQVLGPEMVPSSLGYA